MSSRDRIYSDISAALGRRLPDAADPAHAAQAARIAAEAAALLDDPAARRPALLAPDVIDAFCARLTTPKVAATVERIGAVAQFPQVVQRYLQEHDLPASIALQPAAELLALDWGAVEHHGPLAADEPVAVGLARWGIAEAGSLVFHSGADTAILGNFLPLHHLVLVHARTIVPYLEDYTAAFAATGAAQPRNVNIITGASGTTDIEGSLVLGAHGPRFLHVVIAAD